MTGQKSELVDRVLGLVKDAEGDDGLQETYSIIALVEADVAARLLSDGAAEAMVPEIEAEALRGRAASIPTALYAMQAALRHIGIEVEATGE